LTGTISLARYGKWALIVGGSEGVGAEIARAFAADGLNCLLIARRPEPLDRLAEELRAAAGVEVRALALDIGDEGAAAHIVQMADGLEIGALVCNAGAGLVPTPFCQLAPDVIQRAIRTNAEVPAMLARQFGQGMAARGRGAMLFIGSGAGEVGTAYMAGYSAAKAFQRTLAEALWYELKPAGVDVLALVLGITLTPQLGRMGYPIGDPSVPGMHPAEAACAGLAHLADGPVLHLGEAVDEHRMARTLPRRDAVTAMGERARAILSRSSAGTGSQA
jgi:short-subunit dehydrogenase